MNYLSKVYTGAALLLAAMLLGCSGQATAPEEAAEREALPRISVSFSYTDPLLLKDCLGYGEDEALRRCSLNMLDLRHYWESLREIERFKDVAYDDDSLDYEVAISTAFYTDENLADIALSYLSGMTFTLYPITTKHQVKATIVLRWRDREVARYQYTRPLERQVRLYYPGDGGQEFVDELMTAFLNDAERDGIFSTPYLYKVLGASDYQRQLLGAEAIEGFRLDTRELASNPYRGLQLRYRAEGDEDGQFEVMVYPVPRTEWEDLDATLLEEELRIRHSQANTVLSEVLGSINYADSVFLLFEGELSLPVKGLLFRGEISPPLAPRLWRDTYVLLREDKFIQIRATCPDQACLARGREFARALALGLEVPGESAFMADLRRRHRRISLNR